MFIKYFLSLFVTLFLGPGTGHIILGKYKKAAVLIGIALFFVVLTGIILMFSVDRSNIPQNFDAMKEYVKSIISQESSLMFYLDAPIAAVWAYAFADIIRSMITEYKSQREA